MRFGTGISLPGPSAPAAAAAWTPASLSGLLQWCRADQGITIATGVSQWNDISGAGLHYTQGTTTLQPAYNATGGPNSTAIVAFDGANDALSSSLTLPAPGTTPTYIWMIVRFNSWTSIDVLCSGDGFANRLGVRQAGVTPAIVQRNAGADVNSNTALAISSWGRLAAYFSNSTADFLKLIATEVTGAGAGNNARTGGSLLGAASAAGANASHVDVAELLYLNRLPSASERTQLDAYCTARYGAGLV